MAQIIAGIYEIQEKIGAGGGGIVYLGRHLRLDKQVVLKADKRTLKAGTETLRREVDMLKDLSHTYIPQVYDFVQEDGVVYTVMDFIQGESLDKLLGRKELPSQPQVIRWACQLLEALSYLHERPPHGILHGDIKPANIMLRPGGDICLIDFNIALALGEDGAVKVGFSRGYASPEHYGADYISSKRHAAVGQLLGATNSGFSEAGGLEQLSGEQNEEESDKTLVDEDSDGTLVEDSGGNPEEADTDRTSIDESSDSNPAENQRTRKTLQSTGMSGLTGKDTAGKKGGILLDVRSDIYSLGATFYHLLSGYRPAQDAREVEPLGPDVCSPEVAAVIAKAMNPDPERRYQTAEEMRLAFLDLHKNDIGAVRHRRRIRASVAVLTIVFLVGGCSSFIGLKQLEQRQTALTLAEYSANALAQGDVSAAVNQALQAIPEGKSILEAPVTAQAQKALTDALGVYDLSDGFKSADTIELPGAPFDMSVSPAGTRLAVVYGYEATIFDLDSRSRIATLQIQNSALSDCLFTDENHVVHAGKDGVALYDLTAGQDVWTGEAATTLAVSGDGGTIAAVNRNADYAVIYNAVDGSVKNECSFQGAHMTVAVNDIFADPKNDIFALNADGSMLAVSFHNGGLWVMDIDDPEGDLILYEESDYGHFEGGFYGKYFAFTAEKSGEAQFGIVDTIEATFTGGYTSQNHLMLQAGEGGIYLASGNLLVQIDPDTFGEREMAYTDNANIIGFCAEAEHTLVTTEDGRFSFYDSAASRMSVEEGQFSSDFVALSAEYAVIANRNEPSLRLMALENHQEAQLLSYDARYDHDEARVSQDGQTVMLFGYRDFRIYDMEGELVAEGAFPDADHIYDQQFRKSEEGSWLEVIWYDGTRRLYSAVDGSVLSEESGAAPQKDLYEEFLTDRYRVASSLHEAPVVYELNTGRQIAVLEEDGYLTYVNQFGDGLITEYIATSGERYGLLLDEHMEKLAYLPGLCDVAGDMLVFDCGSGNLRQCRLYSIQELIALGEAYIQK